MQLRRLTVLSGLALAAEMLCAAGAAADEFASGEISAWHLTVLDGDLVERSKSRTSASPLRPVSIESAQQVAGAARAAWSLQLGMVRPPHAYRTAFGPVDGTPLSGDFNGDGFSEMAMYVDGRWYVDFNGNSEWDAQDLLVHLGGAGDRPIVGDWNGDGKDDLGVVSSARGAAQGIEQLASAPAEGIVLCAAGEELQRGRAHQLFRFGDIAGTPVVGDWSNTGRQHVGMFADGVFTLDLDGDHKLTNADVVVRLGHAGDLPVVGDFNRDGRDDLGVYRRGVWHIDTTGDLRLGDGDLSYQLGDNDDTPVVGDWDGDGRDQIGVVHREANGSRPPSVR